ncbi:MAG: anhydro-N-acetylmuramic acid kinase [Candidatus Obscuribacterales bacterium]|nr:anhydro-N-acetylmuramic acid kinase [Candidatus Obscuribacterales bacterium]
MKVHPLTVIGLNSGTSMDGIDAAAFRISPESGSMGSLGRPKLSIEMLGYTLYEFEAALKKKMKSILSSGEARLEDICRLDAALGEEFAQAVRQLLRSFGTKPIQVDLIGSHGQTIWHAPSRKYFAGINCANTMQLGQAAIIAERSGIPVISDFRVQDMAAGGQGAPLLSFADEVLFGERGRGIGILNIGGIANITAIDQNGKAIIAFDTGPGNMIADRIAEKLFNLDFDQDGARAERGKVDENWIQDLLRLPYFSEPIPKTTGRELFGIHFADELIDKALKEGKSPEDLIACLSAFTAAAIADQYERFILPRLKIEKLVLGGGGAENKFIVSELEKRWPSKVELSKHEDYGISSKFKESLLFALLAYTCYFRIPNNVPICTGAQRAVCMGKLSYP